MSAGIYYRPTTDGTYLDIGSDTVANGLGLPRIFTASDIDWLRGYAKGSGRDMTPLIDAIMRHIAIEVWAEH